MVKPENIILDACSIINLINGDQIINALNLTGTKFFIGQAVYNELAKVHTQKVIIDTLINEGILIMLDVDIDVDLLISLYKEYNLGDGETESMVLCKQLGFALCCDDRKARKASNDVIGEKSVMGSLRLMKFAVIEELIVCTDAELSLVKMKLEGGFLPNVGHGYFCVP